MNVIWFWVELFQVTCRRAILDTHCKVKGKNQVFWPQEEMVVPLSPGISLGPNLVCFISANSILSNSSDCLSNLIQTNAMNEKRLWLGKVYLIEDLLWGKYQYDSWIWLMSVLGKNKVPNGDLTEEELGGRINSFLCSVGRFFWAQRPSQCVGECVYSTYTYTEVFSYFCWYFI